MIFFFFLLLIPMNFHATKKHVSNRGVPPDTFLTELVLWGKDAPEEIFAVNRNDNDIYTLIRPELGPWASMIHRRAAMLEAMRVHAGFESSWNWQEGVDLTNKTSQAHIEGQETGAFQVSFDSTYLGNGAMKPFAKAHGIETAEKFIPAMKADRPLALEYYARLVRVSIQWAGPLKRHEINPSLSRESVAEFESFLV